MKAKPKKRVPCQNEVTLLTDLYDIEKTFKEARERRIGEPKIMVAWWNGSSLRLARTLEELEALPLRLQNETTVTASGVSHVQVAVPQQARFGIRCVAINAGDGFKPLQALELEYALRRALNDDGNPPAKHQPWQGPMADLRRWVTDELDQIKDLCAELERIDPSFAKCKAEHEARNNPLGWSADEEVPHTMEVAIEARHALVSLEKIYARQEWRSADRRSTGSPYGFAPLVIRIVKLSHHAGVKKQELRSITASFRTLSTLGAKKNAVRKIGARAEFIMENDTLLTGQNGKKPSTRELMRFLDGKTDPESGQVITSYEDGDDSVGIWMIQWADDEKQTEKQFAVKLSELRRKGKPKIVH